MSLVLSLVSSVSAAMKAKSTKTFCLPCFSQNGPSNVNFFLEPLHLVRVSLRMIFPLHWIAWHVGMASIQAIIDAPDQTAQDVLLNEWREMIVAQLNSVGFIVRRSIDAFNTIRQPYDTNLLHLRELFWLLWSSALSHGRL